MDLEERRRRVARLEGSVAEREAKFRVSVEEARARNAEFENFYYPEPPEPPEPYDEPDFDEYDIEAAAASAAKRRDADKASLDEAKALLTEEKKLLVSEQSAQIIRSADEERAGAVHWDRRFHTSLAIGHGAAFAAIVAHAFDHDTAQAAIRYSLAPLMLFGLGLISGGAIPLILARRGNPDNAKAALEIADAARRDARAMAIISAILFVLGLFASVAGVWGMAFLPEKPTVEAAASSRVSVELQPRPRQHQRAIASSGKRTRHPLWSYRPVNTGALFPINAARASA